MFQLNRVVALILSISAVFLAIVNSTPASGSEQGGLRRLVRTWDSVSSEPTQGDEPWTITIEGNDDEACKGNKASSWPSYFRKGKALLFAGLVCLGGAGGLGAAWTLQRPSAEFPPDNPMATKVFPLSLAGNEGVYFDWRPPFDQGDHGVCWRMAASNVLTQAISNDREQCPREMVDPLSFHNDDEQWDFGKEYEGGPISLPLVSINTNKRVVGFGPFHFDRNSEKQFVEGLVERARSTETSQHPCSRSEEWNIATYEGTISLNRRFVGAICQLVNTEGIEALQKRFVNSEGVEVLRTQTLNHILKRAAYYDDQVSLALRDSLLQGLTFTAKYRFENNLHGLLVSFGRAPAPKDLFELIFRSMAASRLPVILHIEGHKDIGRHGAHALVASGVWLSDSGKMWVYLTNSWGRQNKKLQGWVRIEEINNSVKHILGTLITEEVGDKARLIQDYLRSNSKTK